MKIILEEECALINKTGIGCYTLALFKVLKNAGFNPKIFKKDFMNIFIKNPYLKFIAYYIWYNTTFLLKLIFSKQNTILIATNFFLPFIKIKKITYIPVIHDLRLIKYPKTSGNLGGAIFRKRLNHTIKNADRIITVSNTVKNEIINQYNYPEDKIYVVYNTMDMISDSSIDIAKYNIEKKQYILSVCTLHKHKNIQALIDAFEKISNKYPLLKLVLTGSAGNDSKLKFNNKNIIFTGYLKDAEIHALYSNALLYVFPSLYEGFGIPIIEAQYCGCPVLCSDIPVFKEVAGNSAEFCKPDENDIAEKMQYLINAPARLEALIKLGYENIKRFSNDNITKQLKNIIKD